MADWKQITARIRRARGSKDPAGQLTLLFEKTKDAMVAFELGRHFEIVHDATQAVHWYQTAFARFRRGDWKTKSGEAVLRLGGELPKDVPQESIASPQQTPQSPVSQETPLPETDSILGEPAANVDAANPVSDTSVSVRGRKRRRRGRRGGRNRAKKPSPRPDSASPARPHREPHSPREVAPEPGELLPPRSVDSRSIPRVPVEQVAESAALAVKGRFGDPGLSSRLTRLEMQLRRLLTCPAAQLGHADHAPVGPGVFVLTDDDMTTYYHVEACDTLRVAIANLARSGSARRGNAELKSLLASHLGIAENRVSKYLEEHCVVRWLQLDEGAGHFAHFAIAVLRPILND